MQIPQSPLLSTLERKSGLISYLGVDGNVYVSDQGGANLKALTDNAHFPENDADDFQVYQHPAWSMDGKYLAFTELSREDEQPNSNLYIADLDKDEVTSVYSSSVEIPYYLYWSPDNKNVSFLTTAASGQTQILKTVSTAGDPKTLDTGSPFYWSWAPDGDTLFVHAVDPSGAGQDGRLAFLSLGKGVTETGVDVQNAVFQAPAWSPDGVHILLAVRTDAEENAIVITDGDGTNQKSLGTFNGAAAFAWSPDSQKVAFIESDEATTIGILGSLHVQDLETSEEIVTGDQVIAFFWSPDSRELAYFIPFVNEASSEQSSDTQTQTLLLELDILDVNSGESRKLLTFQPTSQFADMLPYFDQYHQSTTIWSPDNNNLVLSFVDNEGSPGIAIVAASGRLEPRLLAAGFLGLWSWR